MSYPFVLPNLRAQCLRVIDEDTIDVLADCGFREYRTMRLRLVGIDTPELNSKDETERAAAQAAKAWLSELLHSEEDKLGMVGPTCEWPVRIVTFKDPDSFGRWLADVFVRGGEEEIYVNAEAIKLGYARPYVRRS